MKIIKVKTLEDIKELRPIDLVQGIMFRQKTIISWEKDYMRELNELGISGYRDKRLKVLLDE